MITMLLSRFAITGFALILFLGVSSAHAADPKKPDAKAAEAAATPAPPPTEYGRICQADVSYLWQLAGGEGDGYARKVFYATVSEQGSLVEDIKGKLNARLASVQAQAIDACRGDHQSKSGCVMKKLSNLSGSFPGMDFSARQLVMNSVRKDCSQRIGKCLSTQISEMKCWLYVPSEAVIPDEPKVHVEQGAQPELDEETIDDSPDAAPDGEAAAPDAEPTPKIVVGKPAPIKKPKPRKPKAPNAAAQASPTPETNPFNRPVSPF